jgi:hypothetical protein
MCCRQYDDSKALSASKRSMLFEKIKLDPEMVWRIDAISSQSISSKMLAPSRMSLNEIAVQSTLQLLRSLQQDGMNITSVCSLLPTTHSLLSHEAKLVMLIIKIIKIIIKKIISITYLHFLCPIQWCFCRQRMANLSAASWNDKVVKILKSWRLRTPMPQNVLFTWWRSRVC